MYSYQNSKKKGYYGKLVLVSIHQYSHFHHVNIELMSLSKKRKYFSSKIDGMDLDEEPSFEESTPNPPSRECDKVDDPYSLAGCLREHGNRTGR